MTGTEKRLDVWIDGEGVRRGVEVVCTLSGLRVGRRIHLPYDSLFWTSRRAGLLMVFGRERTVALKGEREELDTVARLLEAEIAEASAGARLPDELTGEGVLWTAGAAVHGRIGGREVGGLRVLVLTRSGLHLVGSQGRHRLAWPPDEATAVPPEEGRSGLGGLRVREGADTVQVLYLFPEEIRAALKTAGSGEEAGGGSGEDDGRSESADGDGETSTESESGRTTLSGGRVAPRSAGGGGGEPGNDGSLEMFARGEVAPPVRAELPVLQAAAGALPVAAETAAERLVDAGAGRTGLDADFLETHVLELGEIALGPLLLRKSAASSARTLERAVEAMDPAELQEDTRAAVANAAGRSMEVYRKKLTRTLESKRALAGYEDEEGLDELGDTLRVRMQAPFEKMSPLFRDLEEARRRLLRRLQELEAGPPDAEEAEVREALDVWKRALGKVDRGFESAWHGAVGELVEAWEERFLPRLEEVAAMPRRRVPEWVQLVLLAVATLLVVAALVMLFVW